MADAPRIAPRQHAGQLTSLIIVSLALTAVAVGLGSAAAPTLAAGVTFNLRFSTNDTGDVVFAANTIMMCSVRPNQCPSAEAGQGGLGNLNNDKYSMIFVNVDTATPGLFNSSSADLALPNGISRQPQTLERTRRCLAHCN
jgi:hypothetical protein